MTAILWFHRMNAGVESDGETKKYVVKIILMPKYETMACLLLAAKLDLNQTRHIKIQDLITIAYKQYHGRDPKPEDHAKWKRIVLELEMEVLIANHFDIDVDLPYTHLLRINEQFPKEEKYKNIHLIAWTLINDR